MKNTKMTAPKTFNKAGWALLATAGITSILQIVLIWLPKMLSAGEDSFWNSDWYTWISTFVPLYLVGFPIGILILRSLPCESYEQVKLSGKNFFVLLLMCFPMMYIGNLIGTFLSSALSGGTATNSLYDYIFSDNPIRIVVIVVLAPLFEEYVFRKLLIDHTAKYGEKTAILYSALAFGLFHMNLYQFFYAFGLGLVLGYVYTRTRKLHYSLIMHMIINFVGSVLAPLALSGVSTDSLNQMASGQLDETTAVSMMSSMAGYFAYIILYLGLSIAGLILLIVKARKFVFLPASEELPKEERFKSVYLNIGTILYIVFCIAVIVMSLMN